MLIIILQLLYVSCVKLIMFGQIKTIRYIPGFHLNRINYVISFRMGFSISKRWLGWEFENMYSGREILTSCLQSSLQWCEHILERRFSDYIFIWSYYLISFSRKNECCAYCLRGGKPVWLQYFLKITRNLQTVLNAFVITQSSIASRCFAADIIVLIPNHMFCISKHNDDFNWYSFALLSWIKHTCMDCFIASFTFLHTY